MDFSGKSIKHYRFSSMRLGFNCSGLLRNDDLGMIWFFSILIMK
jgi:hypothetical protein